MIRLVADNDGKAVRLYRWNQREDGKREYETYDHKTRTLRDGEQAPWFQVFSMDEATALYSALADILDVEAEPEVRAMLAAATAELNATKLHLSDMRQLAMLDPK